MAGARLERCSRRPIRAGLRTATDATTFSAAEIKLLDAVNTGRIADYRSSPLDGDVRVQGGNWGDERTISANTIYAIINQAIAGSRATPAGLRVAGARIAGELQFASAQIPYPFELIGCRIDSPINLNRAKVDCLNLTGSHVSGIQAQLLETSNVFLSDGFVATGEICLRRARIGGDLSCIGARFDHPERLALDLEGASIHGHLLLSNGLTITGQINLAHSKIGGLLYCAHSMIETRDRKC